MLKIETCKRKLSVETETKAKTVPLIELNPLDSSSQYILNRLLRHNRTVAVFKKGYVYSLENQRQVRLTNSLVIRDILGSVSELCYFVLAETALASGGFASVFDLSGVITYQSNDDGYAFKKLDPGLGQWVLKEFGEVIPLFNIAGRRKPLLSSIENEVLVSRKIPHLRASPLLGGDNRRYIMMKKFAGEELFNILNKSDSLTIYNRVELALLLLRALQKQVHDYGLVHCDFSPENIIVNLSTKPYEVNVVDVAFAKTPGTLSLSPPEVKENYSAPECYTPGIPIYQSADVYSLGRVLQLLFGFYQWHSHYDRDYDQTLVLDEKYRHAIKLILNSMVIFTANERASLEVVEGAFTRMLTSLLPTSSVLNQSPALADTSAIPFDFFAPCLASSSSSAANQATVERVLNKQQFNQLVTASINAYEQNRGSTINSSYLADIEKCQALSEFINVTVQYKSMSDNLINSNSLICYFFNEAEKIALLDCIKHELMIDSINPSLLIAPGLSYSHSFFCRKENVADREQADDERQKLQELLERYIDYKKGDILQQGT